MNSLYNSAVLFVYTAAYGELSLFLFLIMSICLVLKFLRKESVKNACRLVCYHTTGC
jgi:hypothetical protein